MSIGLSAQSKVPRTLKHRWEFERAYRHGKKVWNEAFVVYVLPTPPGSAAESPIWRCGITATKKVGKAVQRHRAKRLVRESLRLSAELIRDGVDIVVVVRQPAVALKCPRAQRLILDLLARGGALKRRGTSATERAAFVRRCFERASTCGDLTALAGGGPDTPTKAVALGRHR